MSESNKGPTVLEALSSVVGIPRPEMNAIWQKVKANNTALKGCAGPHDFVDITPEKPIGKRFRCSKCTGEIDGSDRSWYLEGLAHGRAEAAAGS